MVKIKPKLILYTSLLIALTSFDYILYVQWIQKMKNYKWYAGSFVFPLFGCLLFWLPVWYKKYIAKYHFTEEYKFPQKRLFALGTFDSINSILGTYATPYLSVLLMTILDKLSLPLTMISSCVYLKTKYQISHFLGAFLTVYGVAVSFIPEFSEGAQVRQDYWLALYIISLIPGVMSYCYKEKNLKDYPLDIWWMNAWISIWQIVFGIITFPVILAPLPSGDNVTPSEIGHYLVNATRCQFGGVNSQDTDNCQGVFWIFIWYQAVSTLCNILMFLIIREESSVVYQVINTLKMPITAWLGSYPSLVGDQAQNLNPADTFSFVMISVGVIVYNWNQEVTKQKRSSSDELTTRLVKIETNPTC